MTSINYVGDISCLSTRSAWKQTISFIICAYSVTSNVHVRLPVIQLSLSTSSVVNTNLFLVTQTLISVTFGMSLRFIDRPKSFLCVAFVRLHRCADPFLCCLSRNQANQMRNTNYHHDVCCLAQFLLVSCTLSVYKNGHSKAQIVPWPNLWN